MADFTNQIAVVTGASSGVGRAIALALAEQGATVCLVGRKLEALQSVSGSAGSSRLLSYQADLTNDEEIHELAARLQRDLSTCWFTVRALSRWDRSKRLRSKTSIASTALMFAALTSLPRH